MSAGAESEKAAGKRKATTTPKTDQDIGSGAKPPRKTRSITAKSPPKSVFSHDTSSGYTPPGASDEGKAVLRMEKKHPGVPGHTQSSPVIVSTPSWQKKD